MGAALIDLHSHTLESDGSWSPEQLVEQAVALRLEALAITDHDTFSGYDLALARASAAELDLVCGIEISSKLERRGKATIRNVHLLGYFLDQPPSPGFRVWLGKIQASRRDRNRRLAAKLQSLGLKVKLEEAEAFGRTLTGRPHFAKVLIQKGYASSVTDAFERHLDEAAQGYVPRHEPTFAEAAATITASGGLAVLAHPYKLTRNASEPLDMVIGELVDQGIRGIEAYHSEHTSAEMEQFAAAASAFGLAITGGSDFHGDAKPGVKLGSGKRGNVHIPREVLDRLRNSKTR